MKTIFKKGDEVEFIPEIFFDFFTTMYHFSISSKYNVIDSSNRMVDLINDKGAKIPISIDYIRPSISYIRNKKIEDILS